MATQNNEIKTYFGRCRCCLNYGYLKTMWTEHFWEGTSEVYGSMLFDCFAISWEQPSLMEHDQICNMCVLRLRDAYKFKKLVLESQLEFTGTAVEIVCEVKEELESPEVIELDINEVQEEEKHNVKKEKDYEEIEYLDEEYLVDNKQDAFGKGAYLEEVYSVDNKQTHEFGKSPYVEEVFLVDNKETKALEKGKTDNEENNVTVEVESLKPARRRRKWPQKLAKKDRLKTYRQYTEEDLRLCLEAVRTNKLTKPDAAKLYNVPPKTIAAKLRAEKEDNGCLDTPRVSRNEPTIDTDDRNLTRLKHRDNIRSVLRCSNATPIRRLWAADYMCSFCTKHYPNPADLKAHTLEHHRDLSENFEVKTLEGHIVRLDITDLSCTVCCVEINDLEELMSHVSVAHEMPVHTDIPNHILPFKFDTDELKCVKCGKQFLLFRRLVIHMGRAHYRNFSCAICFQSFVNEHSLKVHSIRHEAGVFACGYCPKVFKTPQEVVDHETASHVNDPDIRKCVYCNEIFEGVMEKTNHDVSVHKSAPLVFECTICSKVYKNKLSLVNHTRMVHLQVQSHKCSECDMAFLSKKDLKKHALRHEGFRDFLCRVCYKWYSSQRNLNKHMRIHEKDRKYQCSICDQKFVHKWTLKTHMRVKHAHACAF